ncbi:MAG: phosphate transport system permease protein [Frankiales bacterium]|nr:phosphate transport system permease protein [Frankiales bacterium]
MPQSPNPDKGSDRLASPARRSEHLSGTSSKRGDMVFAGISRAAGIAVLGLLVAIAVFLIWKAWPAFGKDKANFFTTKEWDPDGSQRFGILALAYGTVLSSLVALFMAVPVALGVAVYITEYAPRRLSRVLGYVTDMLAAIPSVVYGLWGLAFLVPHLVGVQQALNSVLGWFPLFAASSGALDAPAGSIFAASIVLAIMILPIIAAISREVLRQADPSHKEAALALGATKLEVVRTAVFPPSRSGIVGAIMLGLGRALGETIAVALVLSTSYTVSPHILESGGNTIAANIATTFGEAGSVGLPALIASGLVLFAITLVVNLGARAVIYRSGKTERAAMA